MATNGISTGVNRAKVIVLRRPRVQADSDSDTTNYKLRIRCKAEYRDAFVTNIPKALVKVSV